MRGKNNINIKYTYVYTYTHIHIYTEVLIYVIVRDVSIKWGVLKMGRNLQL